MKTPKMEMETIVEVPEVPEPKELSISVERSIMDGKTYLDFMKIVLICILWYLCSTSDNILGKVVLSSFPYPMTVTLVHLSIASIFLGPIKSLMRVPKGDVINSRYYYSMILPLAFAKFVSSVSSYISLWKVSVSYAHTVKATLPLFTVLLARIILGEKQTCTIYTSLVPIIVGVSIATATELTFDRLGLASSIFSTICFSLQTIFTKKCLNETKYHHMELLTYLSRLATIMLLPIWLLYDLRRIIYDTEFMNSGKVVQTFVMLLCAGLFNMLHNVFAFAVLALVSPLSYAVANASKRIVIISGSLIILQNPVAPLNVVGMLVAIFGVLTYNKAKYDQNQRIKMKEILPYVRSSTNLNHVVPNVGVHHLPHSKSDGNFLSNGHINTDNDAGNGHLLLREWSNSDKFTIIPLSENVNDDRKSGAMRSQNSSSDGTTQNLHSRSVFHL